jgi:quercetin dioxygenase-like cupin family protein
MPFIDPSRLPVREPRPGWRGRFFHSEHMTFVLYDIDAAAAVGLHSHPEEEVWHLLEGELEMTLGAATHVLRAGEAAVVPGGTAHAVRAARPSRALVVDHPVRTTVGGVDVR